MKVWKAVLILAIVALVTALTARWWWPGLARAVGANAEAIQRFEALASLIVILTGVLAGAWAFLRYWGRRTSQELAPHRPDPPVDHIESRAKDGSIAAGSMDRSVAITGTVHGDVVIAAQRLDAARPPSAVDTKRATEGYLGHLRTRYVYLEHKGLGLSHNVTFKLPLLDMYVPLSARPSVPEGETEDRQAMLGGRLLGGEGDATNSRLGEPQDVLALLQENDGLVVLGDPGSGKSTLLKYLAVAMASGEEAALGLEPRLPILIPLADYATAMAAAPGALRLEDFVGRYVREIGGAESMGDVLAADLKEGRVLLLFDGLDEVRDRHRRQNVAKAVADFFSFHRQAGNKFLMTSRIVGYRDVQSTAEGLMECTLADFDDQAIEEFVSRFTLTVERQAREGEALAASEARKEKTVLLQAIGGNEGVRKLAANPLMLTILALMKRHGISLPDRRVELYDQYIRTLLSSWNRVRTLSYEHNSPDIDVTATLRVLGPLALWIHSEHVGLGRVDRTTLERHLKDQFEADGDREPVHKVNQFLADVREHTGILIDRGGNQYGFIHLTFEEYLAAVGIALDAEGDVDAMLAALEPHVGESAWRETVQLLVGYVGLIQNMPRCASALVKRLVDCEHGPPGAAVVLAASAALDAGTTGVNPSARQHVVAALLDTLQDTDIELATRFEAADLLGRLGDPRPGVGTVTVKRGEESVALPDIAWVEVPAGRFWMGSGDDDELAFDHEKPQHELDLRCFWVAKYPLTNAQYAPFVDGGGYDDKQWWGEHGWAWRQGQDSDLKKLIPKKHRETWRRQYDRRPAGKRHQPFWWQDRRLGLPTRPVVGVCWYETMAFARWLAAQEGMGLPGDSPAGYAVRLPTEAEWEKAARGDDRRRWPWGDTFRDDACNHQGLKLEQTSAVGLFADASPCGARDMVGNCHEWTTSAWGETPLENPRFGYPYDARDGRENESLLLSRILRGGSSYGDIKYVRCASRYGGLPDDWGYGIGFRVVFSLAEF